MAEKTATFGIRVPVETNAAEAGDAVESLRRKVAASQDAVKAYGSSLRNLRGTSDEVKEAKAALKAAINAERDAISRNVLELGKHGKALLETSKSGKETTKTVEEVKKAVDTAKGPASDLTKRISDLSEKFTGSGAAANLAVVGMGALATAIVAVGAATISATVSLAKFILEAGNELRTFGLLREAATGSAENAKAFGHQIDAIAAKVPLSRAELNGLSVDISRAFAGTRVSGESAVATFNAVAQASAAMGNQAGSAIQGIIDRGKMFGRFSLGINELQGTGVSFEDVAGSLAKNLKIGINDAKNILVMGRADINDGAKAVRDAVEKRFGAVNLKRMLDLNVIAQKFKDTLAKLTENVKLDSILEGFSKLAGLFDTSTVTGSALRDIITDFGGVLDKVFKKGLPFVEAFFTQLVIESYKVEIALLRLGIFAKQTFGVDFLDGLASVDTAITLAKVSFGVLAGAVVLTGAAVAALAAPFVLAGLAMGKLQEAGMAVGDWFKTRDWSKIGSGIVDGLIQGLTGGIPKLFETVSTMGTEVKEKFKNILGIHSPSAVFAEYGEQTTAGYAKGVSENRGIANSAVASMVSLPTGGGGGGGGGGPVSVHVTLSFPEAKNGAEVTAALTSASFRAQFTRALEEMMVGIGAATHNPQKGVT